MLGSHTGAMRSKKMVLEHLPNVLQKVEKVRSLPLLGSHTIGRQESSGGRTRPSSPDRRSRFENELERWPSSSDWSISGSKSSSGSSMW